MQMKIPYHYTPRDYQLEFIQGMATARFAVLEWARRAGKDMTCWAYAIMEMVKEPMNVVLVFPTKEQGYKSFWTNVENDGFKTIEHVPKSLIASRTNSVDNMSLTLKNGSTFMVFGSTNADALRGANGKIYIFSEFVDTDSEVLGVVRPIVAVNGGKIILNSTPKLDGISGGTFLKLYAAAEKDPTQFASKVYATAYLKADQLAQIRQDYIDQYGNDFLFRQEFLLDENAATSTSYYGNLLSDMIAQGRAGIHPYNSDYPVYTSWDLGMADSTAIFWWQYYAITDDEGHVIGKKLNIIDFYETHSIGDLAIVNFVKSKKYNYGWHFFPHDGAKRDSDAIARIQKIRTMGLVNSSLLKRTNLEMGINKVADLLNSKDTTMHRPVMQVAIDKLKLYKRKFNSYTGDYEGPDHSTESHCADALRYMAEAISQAFDPKTYRFYFKEDDKFQPDIKSEELVKTFIYNEYDDSGDWPTNDWDF